MPLMFFRSMDPLKAVVCLSCFFAKAQGSNRSVCMILAHGETTLPMISRKQSKKQAVGVRLEAVGGRLP